VQVRREDHEVGCDTGLAGIEKLPGDNAFYTSLEIDAVVENARALASQFQDDRGKMSGSSFRIKTSCILSTCIEEELKGQFQQAGSGFRTTLDEGNVSGFKDRGDQFRQKGGGGGGKFRGLQDHTVAGCHGGKEGAEGELQRVVPGGGNENLAKGFSCSTFMLYLGLDTLYADEPHHQILFADDYHRNLNEIQEERTVSEDMSIYVRNSSVTDPLVAPEGHSNLYVLVPTINTRHQVDWSGKRSAYRDKVLDRVEARTGMKDIRRHIVEERIITPQDWQDDGSIFLGATFNLKHTLDQLLYLRPHNRYGKFRNLYLTGGGTHPGSGLPTIYESARISSNLICEQFGSIYEPVDLTTPLLAERE